MPFRVTIPKAKGSFSAVISLRKLDFYSRSEQANLSLSNFPLPANGLLVDVIEY